MLPNFTGVLAVYKSYYRMESDRYWYRPYVNGRRLGKLDSRSREEAEDELAQELEHLASEDIGKLEVDED